MHFAANLQSRVEHKYVITSNGHLWDATLETNYVERYLDVAAIIKVPYSPVENRVVYISSGVAV